jgi:hypothetical protein
LAQLSCCASLDFILDRDEQGSIFLLYIYILLPDYTTSYSHEFECYSGRGLGLNIGFTDHFNTRFWTTSNYSVISTFYESPQHTLCLFQPAVSWPAVPW